MGEWTVSTTQHFARRMKKLTYTIQLFLLIVFSPLVALAEETVFTYRPPESSSDHRYDYAHNVLRLALEKTKAKWGGFKLVPSKGMNNPRVLESLRTETFENPMFELPATSELCEEFGFVPFPVHLGILGYRLFFSSGRNCVRLSEVESIEDLKAFTLGQAQGWTDIDVLESAGLNVVTIPHYDSLFPMVVDERFDLLPRGVNEVLMEADANKRIIGLRLNRTIGIHYSFPQFFFTNKNSTKAVERIYEGLVAAHKDGSLSKLWDKIYGPSLRYGGVDKVRFLEVENPFIKGLDPGYKRFMHYTGQSRN